MDTHYSETFSIFKKVIPFAVKDQKTFIATCGKRFSTRKFSKNPTCTGCTQTIQERERLGREAQRIMEMYK